jgi:hypothetical protein
VGVKDSDAVCLLRYSHGRATFLGYHYIRGDDAHLQAIAHERKPAEDVSSRSTRRSFARTPRIGAGSEIVGDLATGSMLLPAAQSRLSMAPI